MSNKPKFAVFGGGSWATAIVKMLCENLDEVGSFNGQDIIKVDPRYFRPSEIETLLGDASKAKKNLGWAPKISFEELVKEMTDEDLKLAKNYKKSKILD